jgi:excisionase family DNA binding protein
MKHVSPERTGVDRSASEPTVPDLLTVGEVARRLRVDDTTVRRWIKTGAMEAVLLPHLGKRRGYRVRRTTLETLLATKPSSAEHPSTT